MQLFYHPDIEPTTSVFTLNEEESGHLVKALRKREGDAVWFTNGKGELFSAALLTVTPKNCSLEITSVTHKPSRNYSLHIAVAPPKMPDRLEWFVEKATEIGVDEITLLICQNSERDVVKLERLKKIMVAAMKQSLQCYLPRLHTPVHFLNFMERSVKGQGFMAHCREGVRELLAKKALPGNAITVLIGPEGDFSEKEVEMALGNGFLPVSLGATRLRTETAALAACYTIALINS